MALTCANPDCEEEFDYEETDDGTEVGKPLFKHLYVSDDDLGGVVSATICSRDCMRDYLDALDAGEVDQ